MIDKEEIIKELDKQNRELGEELSLTKDRLNKEKFEKEHYKHLYSEIKKQKEDIVEDIKKQITFCTNEAEGTVNNNKCWMTVNYLKKLLRMLGEIDEIR